MAPLAAVSHIFAWGESPKQELGKAILVWPNTLSEIMDALA
jgi:hypothetical protein